MDILVQLKDTAGIKATVRLGSVGQILYPTQIKYDPEQDAEEMPTSFRIPIDAFTAANPFLKLSELTEICLLTDVNISGIIHCYFIQFTD